MKSAEEQHARNLQESLVEHFSDRFPTTKITLNGAGVHWRCYAKQGENECLTDCFDDWGPQYLTSFQRNGETVATGRTSLRDDTVNAISDWLAGHELSQLYKRFRFVDFAKRALTLVQKEIFSHCPELRRVVQAELEQGSGDVYYLWFRRNQRSCQLAFYGKSATPEAVFFWEHSELFRFMCHDRSRLAAVLSRWLGDWATPSTLRLEFPWLAVDESASDYELGTSMESAFRRSWTQIEDFYSDDRIPFAPQARRFISQLRLQGYDKVLRAGQSLWMLIVSRSRRHGLRADQPSVAFCFDDDGMEVQVTLDGKTTTTRSAVDLTPEVDSWLKSLAARSVD